MISSGLRRRPDSRKPARLAPGRKATGLFKTGLTLASPGVVDYAIHHAADPLVTTVVAMIIGTALALVIHRTDFRWPNTMTGLLGLSFYFPSFIF